MNASFKSAAAAIGLTVLLASAAPAQASDRHYRDNSGLNFSVTLGEPGSLAERYYGPRHDSWRRYPSYGYGHSRHPGYDYVRRNYSHAGHACFWDIDRERLRGHRWVLIRELNCYTPYGRLYEIPHSRQIVQIIPDRYDRHDRPYRRW